MSRRKHKPAPPRDGSESRMPLLSRLAHGHAQVLVFTLGQLSIKPLGTFLTALVIGITLAMPAGLHLLVKNLGTLSHSWERSLQASLFLKEDVDDAQAQALSQTLRTRPGIDQVRYISRDEAMAQFREHSGFGEALDILETNPLPAVIVVFPDPKQTPATIELLVDSLAKLPEVDQATLDQQWLQRLYAILEIVRRGLHLGLVHPAQTGLGAAQVEEQLALRLGRGDLDDAPVLEDEFVNLGLDPVHREADQTHPDFRIVALDRLHQADIAFLDQVGELQAVTEITARDVHDVTQVRHDQGLRGVEVFLVAQLAGQTRFVLRRQDRNLIDGADIGVEAAGQRYQ